MTRFLLIIFALLIGMTVVAALWRPPDHRAGKLPLVWLSGSNPARAEQVKTFNDGHPSVDLSLDLGDGRTQKVIMQCSSGVGPDLFDVMDGDQLQTYAEAGVLWDVTDAARRLNFSVENDLWPIGKDEVTYEGRQYTYPCNIGTNVLLYNRNVFDHFGLPYPQETLSWDEFLEIAARVNAAQQEADAGNLIYPVANLDWHAFFEGMKGEFFAQDGTLAIAHSPALKRALEMQRDFIFAHRAMPSALDMKSMSGQGGWGAGSINQFAAGRFAMIVTGEWALVNLQHAYEQQQRALQAAGRSTADIAEPLERPLRLGCLMVPHFTGQPPCYRVRSRSAAINVRSPHREESLAFLQYLASGSYAKLINEAADSLPGNPAYKDEGLRQGPPDLSRLEIHRATKEALNHCYVPRRSPFVRTVDVLEAIKKQVSRLESDPHLNIDGLLAAADDELEKIVQRNLSHDPQLSRAYPGGAR